MTVEKKTPYNFVSVDVEKAVTDTPVWHGRQEAGTEYFSGELCCTLQVLTPLLVGNQQVDAEDGNKCIQPLIFNERVVIPGSSIKGMLRHSISALLNAPMERVAERQFSYRPNLTRNLKEETKYKGFPALVVKPGSVLHPGQKLEVVILQDLAKDDISFGKEKNGFTACKYFGGSVGSDVLAHVSEFNTRVHSRVYIKDALIEKAKKSNATKVDEQVFAFYKNQVLPYLQCFDTGLVTSFYPKSSEVSEKDVRKGISAIETCGLLFEQGHDSKSTEHLLIYVEAEMDHKGKPIRIVSLGHNYYYRWRFRDSIRQTWNNGDPKDRKILSRLEVEKVDSDAADQRPAALSGARLFFGFTADEGNDNKDKVKGLYEQLAGRIAINAALATTEVDKCAKIPLKLAGSPKASAMEFYLQQPRGSEELQADRQDNGRMRTYGDLLDENEKSGELNGRKFYWHQPDAANIESLYSGDKGENASYGRFLTKPGGEFKFKVRFRALRDWELGLLLFTLAPERFGQAIKNKAEIPNEVNGSRFAHKLGYGKPRGLGSVRVQIDKCILLPDTDEKDFIEQDPDKWNSWVNAAVENLDKDTLNNWLKLVRYPASGRCDYPKDKKDEKDGKVYTYHTEIRKSHAKARRMKQNNPEPDRKLLKRP